MGEIEEGKKVLSFDLTGLVENTNRIFLPYYKNSKRVLCLYGGYGSGKSYFACQKILYRILTERNHKILCCRKVATSIRESCFDEMTKAILKMGLYDFCIINKSDFKIFFPLFNSTIVFTGLDDVAKLKSISGITSIWVEEAIELTEDDFTELDMRLRGVTEHYKQILLTYNPTDPAHWIREKFHDFPGDDVEVLHSTYLSNEKIDDEYKQKLEAHKITNPKYYKTRVLGEWSEKDSSNRFLSKFSKKEHVKEVNFIHAIPIILAFDFNISPISCLAIQKLKVNELTVFKEYALFDSNIYELLDHIKRDFPDNYIFVCGDASGASGSAMVKGNLNYYKIIKQELELKDHQLKIRNKNPDLKNSRLLCNTAFELCEVSIDYSCELLIRDCVKARIDNDQKLIKDSKDEGCHLLDCLRYGLHYAFYDIIEKKKRYDNFKTHKIFKEFN